MKKVISGLRNLGCYFIILTVTVATAWAQLTISVPTFPTTNTVHFALSGTQPTNASIILFTPTLTNAAVGGWTPLATGSVGQTAFDLAKPTNPSAFFAASVAPDTGPWQAEALAYGLAITNHGGTISTNDLNVINTFIFSSKSNGYWNYLVDCSPFAGNNTNAAVIKLKAGPGSPMVLQMIGFKSNNWARTMGWVNPDVCAFGTGYTNANAYNGSNGMSVWLTYPTTNITTLGAETIMGHNNAVGDSWLMQVGGSGGDILLNSFVYSLGTLGPANPPGYILGAGLYGFTRPATNLLTLYQNGIIEQQNITPYRLTSYKLPVYVFARYNGYFGPDNFFTGTPLGWYSVEGGMPVQYLPYYYNDVKNMMAGLGRTGYHPDALKCILVVGQSLACGGGSGAYPSAPSTYEENQDANVLGLGGRIIETSDNLFNVIGARSSLAGLTESGTTTGWRAMGEELHKLTGESFLVLHWAEEGQPYLTVMKNSATNLTLLNPSIGLVTNVYGHTMADLKRATKAAADIYGAPLNVIGIIAAHGESDRTNLFYEANLKEWVANLDADIINITGQTNSPKLYSFQESSFYWPAVTNSYPSSTLAMLAATEDNYASNRIVGPRYQMLHQTDNVHLYNMTYRWQGEYAAEAIYDDVWLGIESALRPTNITRVATNIVITYNKPSLVLDTQFVAYATNYGFNYTNSLGQTNIYSVNVSGATSNQIVIALAEDPLETTGTLSYAINKVSSANTVGPVTGARGNVRDSNPAVGFITSSNLYHWSPFFVKPVN